MAEEDARATVLGHFFVARASCLQWDLQNWDALSKMNRIYLIGGEKGGIGKNFISRSLCQYFSSQ